MKKISLFILVILFSMQMFAQEKYTVAVSPTKMNVLYIGVDNPLDIAVAGVNAEDITVTISKGQIVKTDTNYIARVKSTAPVEIKIFKDSELIGTKEFRTKRVPAPVARVGEKTGGYIFKEELLNSKVNAELPNFPFDLNYPVVGFGLSATQNGFTLSERSNSSQLTGGQKRLIQDVGVGQNLYFEDIKAKAPDGSVRSLGTVKLTIDGPFIQLARKNTTPLSNNSEVKISDLMMYDLSLIVVNSHKDNKTNDYRVKSFSLSYFDTVAGKTIELFSVSKNLIEPMKQAFRNPNCKDFVFKNIRVLDKSNIETTLSDFKFTIIR